MSFAHASRLQVATADGPGAGRFLATALLDAIDGGATLLSIEACGQLPAASEYGVDFVFDVGGATEIIRAGLGANGQVITTQLLRCRIGERPDQPTDPAALAHALRAGSEITQIRWHAGETPPRQLEITVRTDQPVTVQVGNM